MFAGTVVTIAGDGFDKDSVGVTFNGAAGEVIVYNFYFIYL